MRHPRFDKPHIMMAHGVWVWVYAPIGAAIILAQWDALDLFVAKLNAESQEKPRE